MAEKDQGPETGAGLLDHLGDLRGALVRVLLVMGAGLVVTWNYSDEIVLFLQKPLLKLLPEKAQHMYYTGITDKFMVYLQISVLASLALTFPYVLYQLWKFISPILDKGQKRFAVPFIFFGTTSFLTGLAFAYWVLIPLSYKYLINFGATPDEAMITLTEYFSLTIKIMLIAGIVFELPMVMILLGRIGIVNHRMLKKYRRHAFLVIAVTSSIATPSPDAVTLAAVMVPLYLLYELSILGVRFTTPKPS